MFIEAFYDSCQSLPPDFRPSIEQINRVFQKSGWVIQPPYLISRTPTSEPIRVHEDAAVTLDGRTQELIQNSLSESERLLADAKNNGRANANRQAVQELLWLLETVSRAFRGTDAGGESVQGEYFNKIVKDLRRNKKGERIEQVLGWMNDTPQVSVLTHRRRCTARNRHQRLRGGTRSKRGTPFL